MPLGGYITGPCHELGHGAIKGRGYFREDNQAGKVLSRSTSYNSARKVASECHRTSTLAAELKGWRGPLEMALEGRPQALVTRLCPRR